MYKLSQKAGEPTVQLYKMVQNEEKTQSNKNGISNGLPKNIELTTKEYVTDITNLDLSNSKLTNLDENLYLPPNLAHLKLSNNNLTEVPPKVLKLNNLKTLDVSFNSIVFFDDTPHFCHTIEKLNLSNNALEGPPCWVWSEKPKNLVHLNLGNNRKMYLSLTSSYIDELLQYKTLVKEIIIHNCRLHKYQKLMSTFCHARVLHVGCEDYDHLNFNNLDHLPCTGLDVCHNVEQINISNTQLYHINYNIDIYTNLKELNLAQNNVNSLPNEFCNLKNLEICVMSCNRLLYLPDDMFKLTKLVRLYLDNNNLCMLPDNLHKISSLQTLDLYNNNLCEGIDKIDGLDELDFAQNYFDEPTCEEYLEKKEKLRLNGPERMNGRRFEVVREETESGSYSSDEDYDDELRALVLNEECLQVANQEAPQTRSSSPEEDWDSDEYWIPQYYKPMTPPRSPWLYFVKKKMAEGNFCPMDAHSISISDQVKYEKLCNPPVVYESDGQFDDYSDDDS